MTGYVTGEPGGFALFFRAADNRTGQIVAVDDAISGYPKSKQADDESAGGPDQSMKRI